jgi:carbon starvation protein CstA
LTLPFEVTIIRAMNTPNFAALAADIMDYRQEQATRDRAALERLTVEVDYAARAVRNRAGDEAYHAAIMIGSIHQMFDDDAVMILAALFHGLVELHPPDDKRRESLFAIHDAIEALSPELPEESDL